MELQKVPVKFPIWIEQGEVFQRSEEILWKRRNLSRFNLQTGSKHFNLSLSDEEIRMHGIVDMAINTEESVYAVEFKLSPHAKKRGDILQLAAYAMLLSKYFLKLSSVGFLVGPGKIVHTVNIDTKIKEEVVTVVREIRQMLLRGRKPNTSASVFQCSNCEYINYCNDRL